MRQHWFRGKAKCTGEWFCGTLYIANNSMIAIKPIKAPFVYVDPNTVSEFTGRYDIHGREIFENHIVEEEGGRRSIVRYSESEAKYLLDSKTVIADLGDKRVKIIGNIFDDHDLLG